MTGGIANTVYANQQTMPAGIRRTRKVSHAIDAVVNVISGEWLLSWAGLSNGGSVIILRALFVAAWVLFLIIPLSCGLKDMLDQTRGWSFDWPHLVEFVTNRMTLVAVVFGSVYTALYARFSAQWRYLADVYNKIKEAEVKYSSQEEAAGKIAEWKAGFAEDAEELHLATKKIFAQVIKTWLADELVAIAFKKHTTGGSPRYENLLNKVSWAVHPDADNRRPATFN
ncbi:hypothetical protein [Pandoraea sp. NPDC087047]|uniref:hypothetical protein n=1 Tax=Pandoraea sp. NPDC087047 TaxID=3364390 RepID=UPI00381F13EC